MNVAAIGIGPLGSDEWNVGSIPSASGATGSSGSSSSSFGDALSDAIGSLQNAQDSATTASQELATGQLSDPTTAITAVENASLSMDFASQIRNQLDTAATTLFQTQV